MKLFNGPLFTLFIFLASCASVPVFNSPNELRGLRGTLYLSKGDSLTGTLDINDNRIGKTIRIYVEDEKKPMQFHKTEVLGYQLRDDYYALKELKGGFRIGKEFSFMKRLTPEFSRIHLYEHREKTNSDESKGTPARYETNYYAQLPAAPEEEVWPLSSSRFVPGFDEKMSRIVGDCPSLARKISAKEPGYFYAQVTLSGEKRAEVLMRIIEEYNACNKVGGLKLEIGGSTTVQQLTE